MEPTHVLVALDGSPLAADALTHALSVFDCRITVLNVVTPVDARMSEGDILDVDDTRRQEATERATAAIDRAKERSGAQQRSVATVIKSGEPAETILEFVEDSDVDHIVIGGHGGERGALTRRLLGTVGTKVVGDAPVSVTVVR